MLEFDRTASVRTSAHAHSVVLTWRMIVLGRGDAARKHVCSSCKHRCRGVTATHTPSRQHCCQGQNQPIAVLLLLLLLHHAVARW